MFIGIHLLSGISASKIRSFMEWSSPQVLWCKRGLKIIWVQKSAAGLLQTISGLDPESRLLMTPKANKDGSLFFFSFWLPKQTKIADWRILFAPSLQRLWSAQMPAYEYPMSQYWKSETCCSRWSVVGHRSQKQLLKVTVNLSYPRWATNADMSWMAPLF